MLRFDSKLHGMQHKSAISKDTTRISLSVSQTLSVQKEQVQSAGTPPGPTVYYSRSIQKLYRCEGAITLNKATSWINLITLDLSSNHDHWRGISSVKVRWSRISISVRKENEWWSKSPILLSYKLRAASWPRWCSCRLHLLAYHNQSSFCLNRKLWRVLSACIMDPAVW